MKKFLKESEIEELSPLWIIVCRNGFTLKREENRKKFFLTWPVFVTEMFWLGYVITRTALVRDGTYFRYEYLKYRHKIQNTYFHLISEILFLNFHLVSRI